MHPDLTDTFGWKAIISMLSLNLPEYKSATLRLMTEVIRGIISLDPLFSGIETITTIHRGPIRNVPGQTPLDQKMFPVSGDSVIPWDSIRDGNIQDYVRFLIEIAESQRKSLARQFFKNMSEITDITGMTIDAKGQPLTFDMILDLIEKTEFGFDESGNPQYPTLVIPPVLFERLRQLTPTPEQEKRRERIIEEKRAKFNASKRTRRLSR